VSVISETLDSIEEQLTRVAPTWSLYGQSSGNNVMIGKSKRHHVRAV